MAKDDEGILGIYQVEAVKHTFKITDIGDEKKLTINNVAGDPFVFEPHELPDSYNWDLEADLNHMKYPDDYQTNQIIGAYLQPVSFTGNFHGPWIDDDELKSAKERSDVLEKVFMAKKPIKAIFGLGNYAGFKGIFIISEFKRQIKNYYDVDYTITFTPHEPQTRVKPKKASSISVAPDVNNVPNPPTPNARRPNNSHVPQHKPTGGPNAPSRNQHPLPLRPFPDF